MSDPDAPAADLTRAERPAPVPTMAAVSIKLPPFWPADPEVWFTQFEAQFTTRGITAPQTRFDYIISSLSPEFTTEVRDLLLKPPAEDPYTTLKTELVKRTATSEQCKLIGGEELSDRKPTQLLRRMQQLQARHVGRRHGLPPRSLPATSACPREDGARLSRRFDGRFQARRHGRQGHEGSHVLRFRHRRHPYPH